MDKRNLKLLYFSPEDSDIKSYNLNYKKILISLSLIVCSIIFLTSLFSITFIKLYNNYNISTLKNQNSILSEQLRTLGQKLEYVNEKMTNLQDFDNQLRNLADLPKFDDDMRMYGVGGIPEYTGFAINELPLPTRHKTTVITDGLSQLDRQIEFQIKSFSEIETKMKDDLHKIKHTPSIRPVKAGILKSSFGKRNDPFYGDIRMHYGIDISAEKGTPIYATAEGKVVEVKNTGNLRTNFGRCIRIDHGNGIKTLYGHLDKITVKLGQMVKRWDKIGEMGRTGRSTGVHLHYQVDVLGRPVNPYKFIYNW